MNSVKQGTEDCKEMPASAVFALMLLPLLCLFSAMAIVMGNIWEFVFLGLFSSLCFRFLQHTAKTKSEKPLKSAFQSLKEYWMYFHNEGFTDKMPQLLKHPVIFIISLLLLLRHAILLQFIPVLLYLLTTALLYWVR